MKHARLKPSAAHTWINCPASIKLSEKMLETESDYMREGTAAHKEAAAILNGYSVPYPNQAVISYFEYVQSLLTTKSKLYVEKLVTLDDNIFGTADAIVLGDKLDIIDFKYGKGVPVTYDEQLKLYALGFLKETGIKDIKVRTHIVQPRIDLYRMREYESGELWDWYERVVLPAEKKLDSEPVLGAWCKFCRGKGYCRKQKRELDIKNPYELNNDELARVYDDLRGLESYKRAVKDAIINEIKIGHKVPGYKVGPGRMKRDWENQEEVLRRCKVLGVGTKPNTPYQVERKLGKEKFEEYFGDLVTYTSPETLLKD